MASETPDKSRVVLRAALDSQIKKTWADFLKDFCENTFKEFASPCKCIGDEPRRLVSKLAEGGAQVGTPEHEMDNVWPSELGTDPFDPIDVGEMGGGA